MTYIISKAMNISYNEQWDFYQWRDDDDFLIANISEREGRYWMAFATDPMPVEISKRAFDRVKEAYNGNMVR